MFVPKKEGDHRERLDRLRAEQVRPGLQSGEVVNIVFKWPIFKVGNLQKIPQ